MPHAMLLALCTLVLLALDSEFRNPWPVQCGANLTGPHSKILLSPHHPISSSSVKKTVPTFLWMTPVCLANSRIKICPIFAFFNKALWGSFGLGAQSAGWIRLGDCYSKQLGRLAFLPRISFTNGCINKCV
jgi:hypothetical protein